MRIYDRAIRCEYCGKTWVFQGKKQPKTSRERSVIATTRRLSEEEAKEHEKVCKYQAQVNNLVGVLVRMVEAGEKTPADWFRRYAQRWLGCYQGNKPKLPAGDKYVES